MGLVSTLSPVRIIRDPISCIECGKCTKACPSLLPVDRVLTIRTPECNGCLTCVSVCPVKDALEMRTLVRRRRVSASAIATGVAVVFVLVVGYAKASGNWEGRVPEHFFFRLIPNAASFTHP
jgi:NAD-dependent dihydropyrimidine dehydrogenase PreA subunit